MAFLVEVENYSLRDAFKLLKEKRSIVNPNPNFWRQLINWEVEKRGEATMKVVETVRDQFQVEEVEEKGEKRKEREEEGEEKKKKKTKKEKKEKRGGTLKLKKQEKGAPSKEEVAPKKKKDKHCW